MITTSLCQTIIVRYARKPIWMPTAKSKLFRIPEHTFYSPEEIQQIKILKEAYKAQEKSIKELMRHEFYEPATQSGGLPAEFIKKELELDEQLYKENDEMNARVAKEKEKLIGDQIKIMEERLLEKKMAMEERLLESGLKVDKYIEEQQSQTDNFITPENIDSMIEKALENPVSFEFFIDRSGRRQKNVASKLKSFSNLADFPSYTELEHKHGNG